jgi:hypothetical protein
MNQSNNNQNPSQQQREQQQREQQQREQQQREQQNQGQKPGQPGQKPADRMWARMTATRTPTSASERLIASSIAPRECPPRGGHSFFCLLPKGHDP